MASPAVAIPNGVATATGSSSSPSSSSPSLNHQIKHDVNVTTAISPSNSGMVIENAQSFSSSSSSASASTNNTTSIKRKRETSLDEGEKQLNHHDNDPHHPGTSSATTATTTINDNKTVNGITVTKDVKAAIRDYFQVLQRYDATPSVLKRPLPDPDVADEPQAKRKKSEEPQGPAPVSIADKVARGDYRDLDSVIFDIKSSASSQVVELRTLEVGKDPSSNDEAIARTLSFKQKAHEIFRREIAYPNVPEALQSLDSTSALQTSASGNVVLSVHGMAPRPTQLYSSLQQPVPTPDNPKGTIRALPEQSLPQGVRTAKAMPFFFPSAVEKDKKSKTLGELFPPPRNLPSLQPPKAPKSTTKGVQVGWHRPELTEKSKYRAGSYSSQPLSTGRWLDYSNAAPPSQIMTKQRERAMSLAGTKPSTSDLEASEMESLFRGAFSSFAPSKDDSAATISSGMISQTLWWQKAGKRSFERLIGAEYSEDGAKDSDMVDAEPAGEIDESLIQEVINNWDDSMIDPGLENACCPKKPDEDKDVDDILQDVSDMIQTLISYQRNRNLQLPTASSQSRYAADPAHSDMLTNGTPVQPSEDETATYETLKAQLLLVIQMLPPYAVARLNSDKLDELNISTKMEVRTDEYQGVMEEDEASARARAASMAASTPRPTTHRSSSSSSSLQYGQQYPTGNRPPMPNQPYYGTQTPVRPPTGMQRPPQTMPPTYSQRPPSNTGYRPPNPYPGTPYGQQPKPQASYSQPGSYGGTPTQGRPPYQQYPGYPNTTNHTPQPRYPSYTSNPQIPPNPYHHQPYQPQHQHPHPHQQPGTPTHAPYSQYTNGTSALPQRTASPHVAHQTPQHMSQPGYNPTATPTRQPSYGGQPNMTNDPSRRFYPPAGSPTVQQHQQPQPQQGAQNRSNSSSTQFQTSLNSHQLQRAMDQARIRFVETQQKNGQRQEEAMKSSVSGPGQSHPQVTTPVGLGGIGLGPDPARMAAARAGVPGPGAPTAGGYSASSQSPKPQVNLSVASNPQPTTNGSPAVTTSGPAANGATPTAGKEA